MKIIGPVLVLLPDPPDLVSSSSLSDSAAASPTTLIVSAVASAAEPPSLDPLSCVSVPPIVSSVGVPVSVPPLASSGDTVATSSVAAVSESPVSPIQSSIPASTPSTAAPSYAQRFKASLRNLRKISSPVCTEDGTPVVQAPALVLLKTAEQWKGHIVAQFHGLIPHPKKIFSDLNPAWGKFGNIVIRAVSDTSCLIFIPCTSTREWVLQVGYWQAGNCAFSVYPWSPDASLQMLDLETAPTWAILENVPAQMYSLDGISVIASAIGEPLHTEKSKLDPFYFGNTKVKVEISLAKPPPTTIIVRDAMMNQVKVRVSYPRLPPKCCNCDRFGHLLDRCPKPLLRKKHGAAAKGMEPGGTAIAETLTPLGKESISSLTDQSQKRLTNPSKRTRARAETRRRSKERSRSSPPVDISVSHKRDQNMSIQTQELVKAWIKESADKKLQVTKIVESQPSIADKDQWIEVGANGKGKSIKKVLEVKDSFVGKVYGKPGAAEPLRLFPGMKSARKLAKLEAKMVFVKKPLKGPVLPSVVRKGGEQVSGIASSSQVDRGTPSVKLVSL